MAPLCSPVSPLSLWRRRDSTNSAPLARVSVCLPDGERVQRDLRINYNMSEVRALLAEEIQFDPDQLDIFCASESELEPVPDSLVLAGLDVEHRDLTLHVHLRPAASPATAAPVSAPVSAPAPAGATSDAAASAAAPPGPAELPPATKSCDSSQLFARRVYEWGWRRRCSLRRR